MDNTTTDGELTKDQLDFWDKAFLTLLPIAIEAQGWRHNNTAVTSGEGRITLAAVWATLATQKRASAFSTVDGSKPEDSPAE